MVLNADGTSSKVLSYAIARAMTSPSHSSFAHNEVGA
jgi:hypothetical protein